MKIVIGSDHAGFEFKNKLSRFLQQKNFEVLDVGAYSNDSSDYPDFAQKVVKTIRQNPKAVGVLICGTGIGMSITANRFKGIRAALCPAPELARFAREHNNANILCIGARTTPIHTANKILQTFLETPFSNEERHQRRIKKMDSNR